MLNISNTFASIWKPEDKGNYKKASISTSKKDKDGNYVNMYWTAKFVGKANVPIEEKQRIKITNGVIECRKYEDKYYYDVVVFDFEPLESKKKEQEPGTIQQVEEDDSELPF